MAQTTCERAQFLGLSGKNPRSTESSKAIKEFMAHYHAERNHQGLDSRNIHPHEHVKAAEGPIKTRSRLPGLLNYYYREAV